MTRQRQITIWLAGIIGFGLLLYLLRGVLTPFVAGMIIAYALDPLADRLERIGLSRTAATGIITIAFFLVAGLVLLLVLPLLYSELVKFIGNLPGYVATVREALAPVLQEIQARLPAGDAERVGKVIASVSGDIVGWAGKLAKGVWSGGLALVDVLSVMLITPLVIFYMIRDWDRMVAKVDSWLPRPFAPEIRTQVRDIDDTLAAFARGQALVCLVLATFYGVGLALAGLDFGMVVGIGAGLISFIPYFGAIVGFVASIGLALTQGAEWIQVGIVAAIFFSGQFIEGNFLTPKLVGDRVGLHPVWVIFALFAGGALFGLAGVLLAVPVAAAIGVLIRYALTRYLASGLYAGEAPARDGVPSQDGAEETDAP